LPDAPLYDALLPGLAATSWPGRFQIVSETPLVVLDGAHNTEAMRTLLATWAAFLASRGLAGQRTHLLFSAVTDKDVSAMATLLAAHVGHVSIVRLSSERSADPADLARHFPGIPCELLETVADFQPDGPLPVLVTGSLFLVGEMLAQGSQAANDLRLNERLEPRHAGS
jgi:dihydrofolate synthase/folylpolyglutamate synthase